MIINYEDFQKVDLRSGTIVKVEDFTRAIKPSYKIWVDFGPYIGTKQTSAQVVANYTKQSLLGQKVVGCVNLMPRNIAGFISEFLLVGFADQSNNVSLINYGGTVQNGQKLF